MESNGRSVFMCLLVFQLLHCLLAQTPCQLDQDQTVANCQGLSLTEVPTNLPLTLQELDLSYNNIFQIKYHDFSTYTNLRALNLSSNNISSIDNGSFASNVLLKNLTLYNNTLTEMPSSSLQPLLNLELLDLSNNFYSFLNLSEVFSTLVNLQSLSIGGPLVSVVLKDDLVPLKNISLKRFALQTMSSLGVYEMGSFLPLDTKDLWLDVALDKNPQALRFILKDLAGKSLDSLCFQSLFEFVPYAGRFDIFSGLADVNVKELTFYQGKYNEKLLYLTMKNIQNSSTKYLNLLSIDFDSYLVNNILNGNMYNLSLDRLVIKDVANPQILKFDQTFSWLSKINKLIVTNVNFRSMPCLAWDQMNNIETLDVSGNQLVGTNLYNPSCQDSELPRIKTFIAADNQLQSLKLISLLTARWPNLTTLDLSSNFLGARNETCTWNSNITTFILMNNIVKVGVFQCLPTTVEYLDLSYSLLGRLDLNYFNKATNLKQVILRNNKISVISNNWKCPSLQVLALEGNSFSFLESDTFKDSPQLTTLTAGNNPYHCTCELYSFFTKTLEDGKVSIPDWPDAYDCYQPTSLQGIKIESYNPGTVACDVRLVVAISVSITALVVIICMVICWRYDIPWYCRMTCQIIRAKYRTGKVYKGREYIYHAFVSYSHSDSDWVRGELLPQLENCSPPYRVCIHERDFLPGKWIIDNIIENIENSHKIIFILSHNFVNSEWCNYELYFAHQRVIGHAFEDIILVVKENVTMEDLPKRFTKLRKIMRSKTYLEWPSEQKRQTFFWIQLQSILGKVKTSVTGHQGLSVINEIAVSRPCPVMETKPAKFNNFYQLGI
ncbi:hypothetical protein GDO86_017877 [Hymenochirus boettgeri]|uniref:TIR domain-containing protein n=1 Tax=Hymenochirus boettgeri TaxID=247094 RepID=A0A8T2IGV2_9PIPI|nr:hypothetical protein GDO86_017877 [Hymenochirus boettgeri]